MHFNIYDVFYSHYSHQHVSAAISAIFMMILLQEYKKVQMWFAVSPLLQKVLQFHLKLYK